MCNKTYSNNYSYRIMEAMDLVQDLQLVWVPRCDQYYNIIFENCHEYNTVTFTYYTIILNFIVRRIQ